MRTIIATAALPLLALAACNTADADNTAVNDNVAIAANGALIAEPDAMAANAAATPAGPAATAALTSSEGRAAGSVTITQDGPNLRVAFTGASLPPGERAVHVHAVGRCDRPDFTTAGPHWNPMERQHGRDNPQGQHMGDLPNVTIAADGSGSLNAVIQNASIAGLLDGDGAAFMVHADADDYRTDPTGNAGDRIACGVLSAVNR